MNRVLSSQPAWKMALALTILSYLTLAGALSYTKRPWVDEAWFANMSVNIAENGKTGISVLDPKGNANMLGREYRRIDEKYVVWMPVQQSLYALWYKAIGFSLLAMRTLSIGWGLVVLIAWFMIVRSATADPVMAVLAATFLSADFSFLYAASDGRMDVMCAGLSYAAIALYLHLREQRLVHAIAGSQALTVTAGLTHPMGAIGFIAVLFLVFYLDRERIKWKHVLTAAGVYLLGVLVVAAYILPDLALFREHLGGALTGRLGAVKSTSNTVVRELTVKYKEFYAPTYTSSKIGLIRLMIPITYLLGVLAAVVLRQIRQVRGVILLVWLTLVSQTAMAFLDSAKLYYYLVHSTPYFAAVLACVVVSLWRVGGILRYASTAVGLAVILLQWGWVALSAAKDPYHRSYLPMADYVSRQVSTTGVRPYRITASAELGFAIGFHEPLRDDALIGYQSGRHADLIVFEERSYDSHLGGFAIQRPEVANYIRDLLKREYRCTYTDGYYKVYTLK